MYIRPKYGPHAGELQFMRVDVARKLIELGRATDPRDEPVIAAKAAPKTPRPTQRERT